MTRTTNNADTVSNPMEGTMTSNAVTTEKSTVRSLLRVLEKAGLEDLTRRQWLAIRKVAGGHIDPDTAEVTWVFGDALHYVSGCTGLPERQYYARSPGSNEWIWFHDLPEATVLALCRKHHLIRDDV
jgi:hypothetical protein